MPGPYRGGAGTAGPCPYRGQGNKRADGRFTMGDMRRATLFKGVLAAAAALVMALWGSGPVWALGRGPAGPGSGVGASGGDLFGRKGAGAEERKQVEPVVVSAAVSTARTNPDGQIAIAVVLDHAPNFHTWPNKPVIPAALGEDFPAIATTIEVTGRPEGVGQIGPVQWPEPHAVRVNFGAEPTDLISYEGRAIAYIPVIIAADAAPGPRTLEVTVSYQACDDRQCYQPQRTPLTVEFEVLARGEAAVGAAPDEALFGGFDSSVFAKMLAGEITTESEFDFFGARFMLADNAYWIILPIAFLAGFLLNLTPCVLPVIPIKVLSLQKQAANPATLAVNGFMYCLGIIAAFAALGLVMFGLLSAGAKMEWGEIYSYTWFTIPLAVIVGVFGLGMMGLFTIQLPKAVYGVNPSLDSPHGNFLFGALTAVLSTPCTGPLLGATLAWAATQPAWVALATITVMGVGMAAPYGLLIAFPKLIDRMPKAGPGGELLKHVMGLFLLAVAAFMGSFVTEARWPWWLVGGFSAAACVWWIIGAWRMLRTKGAKWVNTAIAVIGLAATVHFTRIITTPPPIPWVEYTPEALEAALAEGKIVVIDFTAKWCTNCHVLERTVLAQSPAVELLNSADVVAMQVDLTSQSNEIGWAKQRELGGGGGIPLTAIYAPGRDEPVLFRSFYTGQSLVEAARGEGAGDGGDGASGAGAPAAEAGGVV